MRIDINSKEYMSGYVDGYRDREYGDSEKHYLDILSKLQEIGSKEKEEQNKDLNNQDESIGGYKRFSIDMIPESNNKQEKYYMDKNTGAVYTYKEARQIFVDEYDGDDPTNLFDFEDYFVCIDDDKDESITEDTVKTKDGKWVNRGDDGKEHGEFKTKKDADAQRKAMFARGYKAEGVDTKSEDADAKLESVDTKSEGVEFELNSYQSDEVPDAKDYKDVKPGDYVECKGSEGKYPAPVKKVLYAVSYPEEDDKKKDKNMMPDATDKEGDYFVVDNAYTGAKEEIPVKDASKDILEGIDPDFSENETQVDGDIYYNKDDKFYYIKGIDVGDDAPKFASWEEANEWLNDEVDTSEVIESFYK